MAASDYLNNAQLQMFMPAKKLYNEMLSLDADLEPLSQNEDIAHMKRSENQQTESLAFDREPIYPKLEESIRKEGVKKPVRLLLGGGVLKPLIGNGNHRIVAAHDIDPNMEVPVSYGRDYEMNRTSFPKELFMRTKAEEKIDKEYFAPKKVWMKRGRSK